MIHVSRRLDMKGFLESGAIRKLRENNSHVKDKKVPGRPSPHLEKRAHGHGDLAGMLEKEVVVAVMHIDNLILRRSCDSSTRISNHGPDEREDRLGLSAASCIQLRIVGNDIDRRVRYCVEGQSAAASPIIPGGLAAAGKSRLESV